MRRIAILPLLIIGFTGICQQNLSGLYTEYKRTLWNDDDGSQFTINNKPFKPSMQFEFELTNNGLILKNLDNKQGYYSINKDTLITKIPINRAEKKDTIFSKYVILENNNHELILREYKSNLGKEFYIKKFYLKKGNLESPLDKSDEPKEIFTVVNEMPMFPGGMDNMRKFINKKIAKSELKSDQKVFLKLLINPEGKIVDIDVLNNPKVENVKEAVNIVRQFPDFVPGKQNGRPVYTYYNLPFFFKK